MDPYSQNQGTPGAPPSNPYEFILNPNQPKPKKSLGSGKNGFALKLLLIIGGIFVLMIIIAVVINLAVPKSIGKADFISLAQAQNELIRISDSGQSSAVQQVTRNLATTIESTMITQQHTTLKPYGKVDKKLLALKQNAATDQKFASAKITSTYDTTFAQVAQSELNAYATEVKQLFNQAKTTKDKDMLSDFYRQTQLLIGQVPHTETGIQASGD